jgi:uncharacterized membrane protein
MKKRMRRPSLSAIAATSSSLLGLVLLCLPMELFHRQAGSPDRWILATLIGCALWLGLRGMWRNLDATRYLALAGFVCGCFALVAATVMPHLRGRSTGRPVPIASASASAQANATFAR